jgi:hypothetical protein
MAAKNRPGTQVLTSKCVTGPLGESSVVPLLKILAPSGRQHAAVAASRLTLRSV